jgi:hypothetical protein
LPTGFLYPEFDVGARELQDTKEGTLHGVIIPGFEVSLDRSANPSAFGSSNPKTNALNPLKRCMAAYMDREKQNQANKVTNPRTGASPLDGSLNLVS